MSRVNSVAGTRFKGSKKFNLVKWFKGLDYLSKYFFFVGTLVVILAIAFGVYNVVKTTKQPVGNFYYDENLNFSLVVPSEWSAGTPDKASVQSAVKSITAGTLFDMRIHKLPNEIVPLTLVVKNQNPPKATATPVSTDKSKDATNKLADSASPDKKPTDVITGPAFAKFMTIAFRGVDSKVDATQDKVKKMDDFKALLNSLGHTDVQVSEVTDVKNKVLFGELLKGSGVLLGQKVYYMQYFEPAGKNTLIVTYGSLKDDKTGLVDLDKVVGSIKYLDGGTILPETFNGGPITTGPQVVPPIDNSKNTNPTISTPSNTNGGDVKVQVNGSSDVTVKDDNGNVVNKK